LISEEIAMMLRWWLPGRWRRECNLLDVLQQAIQELKAMSGNLATEIHNLRDAVTQITTVDASVMALIEGFDARVQAAVDKALAAGATEEQLASIREMTAAISGEAKTLGQAVVANTPSAPTGPGPTPEPTEMPQPTAAPVEGEVATSGTLTAG
jgi:hypothetical protein